jgi:hypothetical protein
MRKTLALLMMACCTAEPLLFAQSSAPVEKSGSTEKVQETTQPVNAEVVFARLKRLAGVWQARSTRGWTGHAVARVIGRGSAVLFESDFDDDAEGAMINVYYLDKGRLLLTHYCEAKNQPTLVATGQSSDGKVVLFTFLNGTGMADRNTGHMDKLLFRFISDDSYIRRWTWYGKGSEQWLEEIESRRAPKDTPASGQP